MTHYDTLEISRQASPEVVRAAYRSLIQRFHPDRRPDDAAAARRASEITLAYEVLSDPVRRAAYDRDLAARPRAAAAAPPSAPTGAAGATRRRKPVPTPAARRVSRTGLLGAWALLAIVVVSGVIGVAIWLASPRIDAQTELHSIRQAFAGGGLPEARLKELYARKRALLQEAPELRASASAEAALDLDARTVELASGPLVLRLKEAELVIPRLRIVLGSFDADSVRAHIGRQNGALLRDIARSLAGADAILFNGKAGETLVKELVLNALAKGLGVQASDTYPSTYFESPGRYGVIDVLLPEGISVRPG